MAMRKRFRKMFRLIVLCVITGWIYGCEKAAGQASAGPSSGIPSTTLRVASWNVENLFDTVDDPANPGDDEFTPNGPMKWTESVYRKKLDHLAKIIAEMKPDIIGLCEVENRRVLVDLQQTLATAYDYHLPEIIHREGKDRRGIDVAMLAKLKPSASRWMTANPTAREMLCSTFSMGSSDLTVIMCHWKSKMIPAGMVEADSDNMRIREARVMRRAVEKILRKKPDAAVVVMGDLNDNVTSPILTENGGLLASRKKLKTTPFSLYNLSADFPEAERGTYYYHPKKIWNSFDSISVSSAMLDETRQDTWTVQKGSYQIFKHPNHLNANNTPKAFRLFRPKEGERYYIYGYSDHFPVTVTLERKVRE